MIIKDGVILGKGNNRVLATNDPTSHAEIIAIRDACKNLHTFQLTDSDVYTSCEPCSICMGAIYWAAPEPCIMLIHGNKPRQLVLMMKEYMWNLKKIQ